jgi:glycosyltransferase involved in cell wall biosynthesis
LNRADAETCDRLLEAARADFTALDSVLERLPDGLRVLQTEDFPPPFVEKLAARRKGAIAQAALAVRLLRRAGPGVALLLNEVDRASQLACILNRCRRIVLYDIFFTTEAWLKSMLVRRMVGGATLSVVFSRRQVETYARHFGLPARRFFFIPYKANYSKEPPLDAPPGDYVFSGGNSARDYRTFFEAVRGTGIPCVVSSTAPETLRGLDVPSNVRVVAAREPEFGRLMAGSRFVVMTLTGGRVRGYGEQTVCNGLWHGRPVIAADDVSAADYIEEGRTGHVLAPGDVEGLRERIAGLWADPERCAQMGRRAAEAVRASFTHAHFVARMRNLALLVAGVGRLY